MEGLVPGRIVYFVFDEQSAAEVMRRRTTGASIAERMKTRVTRLESGPQDAYVWPAGAQAHIGNDVVAGDICPAMVVKVWDQASGNVNLQVVLDGCDVYWARSVVHNIDRSPRSWHWMFSGQNTRYQPANVATGYPTT